MIFDYHRWPEWRAKVRRGLRWAGLLLVAALLIPFFAPMAMNAPAFVLSPLSIVMPTPSGFPRDATISKSNFKDGTWWQYCRRLPSGVVWVAGRSNIASPVISFRVGGWCSPFTERLGNLTGSLELPAFTVVEGGHMSLTVPPEAVGGDNRVSCLARFEDEYYRKAVRILKEAGQHKDAALRSNAPRFALAIAKLEAPGVKLNKLAGFGEGMHFCHVS